ncbi:hypothetical protein [Actinoplanes sp. NPDC026670]|uniref:hypothetical protein n=1 Tax=Actinoplanes sp. NPDC026670 TaxID=3154700 RepID=UPI0033CD372C
MAGEPSSDFELDPRYHNGGEKEPPKVWAESQQMRVIVEKADPRPPDVVRRLLVDAIHRQVRTLHLFRAVGEILPVGGVGPVRQNDLTLYAILFPGEGRDNTGIKDLNDNVLEYSHTNDFIDRRNEAIRTIFTTTGPGPSYRTVGQDYKICFFLADGKKPEEVAADLKRLDKAIVDALLKTLDEAIADPDHKHKKECEKLKRTLSKKGYRFDFLIGSQARAVQGDQLDVTFLLTTETLKSAGLARYAVKVAGLRTRMAKAHLAGTAPKTPKGGDDRGRPYNEDTYLRVSAVAPGIKKFILGAGGPGQNVKLDRVLVDKVWTDAFLLAERLFFGNPDVIRDVRKKKLVAPTLRQGVTAAFGVQVDLLETWLVVLNLIDFVSGFVLSEYRGRVLNLHRAASNLVDDVAGQRVVDWRRLTPVLTSDVRQRTPIAQQGATSEFPFFAYSSDFRHQIFVTFDIRDLGVDLMLFYELLNKRIVDDQLTGENLMRATFVSNNRTMLRKRDTYDEVVKAFKNVHARITATRPDDQRAVLAAVQAFGGGVFTSGRRLPAFEQSIRVMVGGDEIFVAAHPLYAGHISEVIRTLDSRVSGDQLINLRAGVGFSAAPPADTPGPGPGPDISPEQRKKNQKSHHAALSVSSSSGNALKDLERRQRRMERLIEMLEDSPDTKKNDLAKGYQKRLDDLHLLRIYARGQHGHARPLPRAMYERLIVALRTEDVPTALQNGEELVDFETDQVINRARKEAAADRLEADLLRDVGRDNFQAALPPTFKTPKLAKWILKVVIRYLTGASTPLLPPEDKEEAAEEEIILI